MHVLVNMESTIKFCRWPVKQNHQESAVIKVKNVRLYNNKIIQHVIYFA
jgi:hypothetical protein